MKLLRYGKEDWDMLIWIHILSKKELVKGLPKTKFVKDKICDACQLVNNKSLHLNLRKILFLLDHLICCI